MDRAALYRRRISAAKQTVTLRRNSVTHALVANNVRARVLGDGTPEEIVGGILQKKIAAVVLAEDVPFPGGLKIGDNLTYQGAVFTLLSVDSATHALMPMW